MTIFKWNNAYIHFHLYCIYFYFWLNFDPSKKFVEVLTLRSKNVTLLEDMGLYRSNQIKMKSLGWVLPNPTWLVCLEKGEIWTDTRRTACECEGRNRRYICKLRNTKDYQPTTRARREVWTLSNLDPEWVASRAMWNFCWSHQVWGMLLWLTYRTTSMGAL